MHKDVVHHMPYLEIYNQDSATSSLEKCSIPLKAASCDAISTSVLLDVLQSVILTANR